MPNDYFECSLIAKSLKTDFERCSDSPMVENLCLDSSSRRRYMEMISHHKVDSRVLALKKIEDIMRNSPEKYHPYLAKLWNLCQNDQLII